MIANSRRQHAVVVFNNGKAGGDMQAMGGMSRSDPAHNISLAPMKLGVTTAFLGCIDNKFHKFIHRPFFVSDKLVNVILNGRGRQHVLVDDDGVGRTERRKRKVANHGIKRHRAVVFSECCTYRHTSDPTKDFQS